VYINEKRLDGNYDQGTLAEVFSSLV
jgi:hypothetical protein